MLTDSIDIQSCSQSDTEGESVEIYECRALGEPLSVSLLELTRFDFRLLSDRPLPYGAEVEVTLCQSIGGQTSHHISTVHWCQAHSCGWQLGLYIHSPIPEAFTTDTWQQLRTSVRYDCLWSGWAQSSDDRFHRILFRDYSLGGLMFESLADFAKGDQLRISKAPSTEASEFVTAKVMSNNPASNLYGCAVPNRSGYQLSQIFNRGSAQHMEPPFLSGLTSVAQRLKNVG